MTALNPEVAGSNKLKYRIFEHRRHLQIFLVRGQAFRIKILLEMAQGVFSEHILIGRYFPNLPPRFPSFTSLSIVTSSWNGNSIASVAPDILLHVKWLVIMLSMICYYDNIIFLQSQKPSREMSFTPSWEHNLFRVLLVLRASTRVNPWTKIP